MDNHMGSFPPSTDLDLGLCKCIARHISTLQCNTPSFAVFITVKIQQCKLIRCIATPCLYIDIRRVTSHTGRSTLQI